MSSRSGPIPSASDPTIPAGSPSTMLARMARCNSSSVGMLRLTFGNGDKASRQPRFLEQLFKRRDIVVPFDQGRDSAKYRERLLIQRPHLWDDRGAMIVDAQRSAIGKLADGVTGEVDFPDCSGWQPREVGR